MNIEITLAKGLFTIATPFNKTEYVLDAEDFNGFELDIAQQVYLLPEALRTGSYNVLQQAKSKMTLSEKLRNLISINKAVIYLAKEYQTDLIIRTLYDFSLATLTAPRVEVLDAATRASLLKPKHTLETDALNERYEATKNEDYLLQ